jgi:DNA polymerase-3 subunit alpha
MKDMLRRARPTKFEELAAFNALYRPGALSVGMVDEFIQRKLGRKKVQYILAETQPILEETYGVIAYQEQVMQIAVTVAGFTMGEADVLRKAMGKKDPAAMAKQKEKFVSGAVKRGVAAKRAEDLWEYIEPFAGYGFNKSHSVAYAMLAYKTAYLKAHHPVAFMAAMLSSEMGVTDEVVKYVSETRDMAIRVLPPDVNESEWSFTADASEGVRFGLGAIKGVGEAAGEAILAARRRLGRFASLRQFLEEVDPQSLNQKVLESLVKSGAFDAFGEHRAAILAALGPLSESAARRRREAAEGQSNLFGGALPQPEPQAPSVPRWGEAERLRAEKEALGFYLSGNPLVEFESRLQRLSTRSTAELRALAQSAGGPNAPPVTVAGIVTRLSRSKIKSGPNAGRVMGRFVLEDLTGSLGITLFADQLQRYDALLHEDAIVLVKGQVRERGSEMELTVEELSPLERAMEKLVTGVRVSLESELAMNQMLRLRDLLAEHPGESLVEFEIAVDGARVRVAPEGRFKVDPSPSLMRAIEEIVGSGTVVRLGA